MSPPEERNMKRYIIFGILIAGLCLAIFLTSPVAAVSGGKMLASPGPMKTGTMDEYQRIHVGYHMKIIGFSLERDYPNGVIPDTCCTNTRDSGLQGIFPGLYALLFYSEPGIPLR